MRSGHTRELLLLLSLIKLLYKYIKVEAALLLALTACWLSVFHPRGAQHSSYPPAAIAPCGADSPSELPLLSAPMGILVCPWNGCFMFILRVNAQFSDLVLTSLCCSVEGCLLEPCSTLHRGVQGVPSLPTICKLMPSHKSSPLRSNGRAATIIFIISCLFKLMPVMLCNHDEDYALIICSKPVIRLFK